MLFESNTRAAIIRSTDKYYKLQFQFNWTEFKFTFIKYDNLAYSESYLPRRLIELKVF